MKTRTTMIARRPILAWAFVTMAICLAGTAVATLYPCCAYDLITGQTPDPSNTCNIGDCSGSCMKFVQNGGGSVACYGCDVSSNPLGSCFTSGIILVNATLSQAPCYTKLFGGCGCRDFHVTSTNTNRLCFTSCAGPGC